MSISALNSSSAATQLSASNGSASLPSSGNLVNTTA